MTYKYQTATLFIPDGKPEDEALSRVTHMAVGAHQDDLEIMAFHGIKNCFDSNQRWFGGVTCTRGDGSPRSGFYVSLDDDEIWQVRKKEQDTAAVIGKYGFMAQLDYPSEEVKSAQVDLEEDLLSLFSSVKPEIVYTHNLADKHASHIGVAVAVIRALRRMPVGDRPQKVYGCEVWRGLDWMLDGDKTLLDVAGYESLAMALLGLFDSQVSGGKRYDLATVGRRRCNATFFDSHKTDETDQLWYAMDLTPLVKSETMDIADYVTSYIDKFREDVRAKILKVEKKEE